MSRVGKKPIPIPPSVKVELDGNHVKVSGPKGTLERDISDRLEIQIAEGEIIVDRKDESITSRQQHGLARSLLDGMVVGVSDGFEINLEIIGVGYKVEQMGNSIMLSLGHSHSIYFTPPEGITIASEMPKRKLTADGTPNQLLTGFIKVSGIDKQMVGQVAAKIRSFRKPDVYKSKGIRYAGERIQIKAGKAAG
ncbi:MAG TPA: 50S ribosomal protein L6 [candidate division Zixibacteria bacterium]|nr:50S ribosomal protein L6 [candidate division Zixibacteria bacterium]